jgi:hypothetical protein
VWSTSMAREVGARRGPAGGQGSCQRGVEADAEE